MIRLDKYLSTMGYGSRSDVKEIIRRGRVSVNGTTKGLTPKLQVDEKEAIVLVDGEQVRYAEHVYYMLHKPQGVVSATEDTRDQTVLDCLSDVKREGLFPVGRLDKDTEGLLLITDDGALAHDLLSPRKHVDKTYFVRTDGQMTEDIGERFAKGVSIGSADEPEICKPAQVSDVTVDGNQSTFRLTIQEGKYHQIKRMCAACGLQVTYLKRERMGSLVLDEALSLGEYRPLTDEEVESLLQ